PAISKRSRYFHILSIVFSIGKHFGTVVILSTAFVHLLQDAFDRLQDLQVKQYTNIGRWTSLIVLSSLLLIFLIEYISTAYVDNLHLYSSEPSTSKINTIQLPPSSPPPVLPTRQAIDHPSQPSAQPRRHAITGPYAHNPVLGHHRHEAPQQHERHYIDHPRCGLTQLFSPEDTVAEDAVTAKVPPEKDHHVVEYQ
ncbi:hypothetical protein BGY98DRAFT_998433, partial [Russula aff. rugulosa BPL654]